MIEALALGALSAGGSLLQGLGQKQASAKQGRLQMIADAAARVENERMLGMVNTARDNLGKQLMLEKETNSVSSWVDVPAMMDAAERSGFNPVTFLNAGGLQAYTQTSQVRTGQNAADAYKMRVPEYALSQASQVPQQYSALSAFGGALSAGASAFGTQYRADMSYGLQSQRLASMAAAGINSGMGLSQGNGLMTALSFGSQSQNSRGGALSPFAYPSQWKPGDVEVTHPFGRGFIDPTVSNASTKEDRYGEPGDWLFGIDTMVSDAVRNLSGRTLREWGQAAGMNIGDYARKADTSWGPAFSRWWNSPTSLPNYRLPGFAGTAEGYIPFPGANAY